MVIVFCGHLHKTHTLHGLYNDLREENRKKKENIERRLNIRNIYEYFIRGIIKRNKNVLLT